MNNLFIEQTSERLDSQSLSNCPSRLICPSLCLSTFVSVHLSVCVYQPLCLSICSSRLICPSVCLSSC